MKDGYNRYCDRCGVMLNKNNNKCGFELCDNCNDELERSVKRMTIDDHIEVLKSYNHGFTAQAGNLQDSIDVAVDIMRKYQKIQVIVKRWVDVDLKNSPSIADTNTIEEILEVLEDGNN